MGVTVMATYSSTGDVPYIEASHIPLIVILGYLSHVPHLLKEAVRASESPFVPSGSPVQSHNRVIGHEF